nr:restriction endonuclease subunit S [Methylomicrobium lacus]
MNQDNLKELLLALSFEPTGQNSINATKMRHLKVPLPPLSEQQRFLAEIEQLEQTSAAAPSRKQAVMQRYL